MINQDRNAMRSCLFYRDQYAVDDKKGKKKNKHHKAGV